MSENCELYVPPLLQSLIRYMQSRTTIHTHLQSLIKLFVLDVINNYFGYISMDDDFTYQP